MSRHCLKIFFLPLAGHHSLFWKSVRQGPTEITRKHEKSPCRSPPFAAACCCSSVASCVLAVRLGLFMRRWLPLSDAVANPTSRTGRHCARCVCCLKKKAFNFRSIGQQLPNEELLKQSILFCRCSTCCSSFAAACTHPSRFFHFCCLCNSGGGFVSFCSHVWSAFCFGPRNLSTRSLAERAFLSHHRTPWKHYRRTWSPSPSTLTRQDGS